MIAWDIKVHPAILLYRKFLFLNQMDQFDIWHLGPALKYFFDRAKINVYQRQIPISLLKAFPILKAGYALKATITNIFRVYMCFNTNI